MEEMDERLVNKAASLLSGLSKMYCEVFPDKSPDHFLNEFFDPLVLDDSTSGDAIISGIKQIVEGDTDQSKMGGAIVFAATSAYLAQVLQSQIVGKFTDAWCHLADASYWYGTLVASKSRNDYRKKNPAAEMAFLRHAENYALIRDAIEYWRESIDPALSAAKAANELIKIVPLSHKKLSEIVSAEKKKLLGK